MLSLTIFTPLLGFFAVLAIPKTRTGLLRLTALAAAGLALALAMVLWLGFEPGTGPAWIERAAWIESLNVGYAVGVDGLSLSLVALTALLFVAALVFSWNETDRPKEYYAWFLLLETACLGVFSALDLFLFFIFWDLSLVCMYFIIALWGHEHARAAALKFFIYTFVGSIALLLGIIGLFLASDPHTTDMLAITAARPLAGGGWLASVIFFALLIGFGIKTPLVPFHTWLPPAHAEAPAPASAILAGVLLKMGTYGFFRILIPMLPETARHWAWLMIGLGVLSAVYGALVALAQTDLKRLIAYTSVNHMGYVVLAAGAVALAAGEGGEAARLATSGAVLQMVSHGLITGALFLFAGTLWRRTQTFEIGALGGLAAAVPVLAGSMALAAFASLGLPGLSGFVAEFQIFVGSFRFAPWGAGIALTAIVITAGLFLWMLQRVFLGPLDDRWRRMEDLQLFEKLAIFPLLALVVLIGLLPMWILDVIDGFARGLSALLG